MTARLPFTPPASPLAMPTQILSERPKPRQLGSKPSTWMARLLTFGGSLALTLVASRQLHQIIPFQEVATASSSDAPLLTALLWSLLCLFTITFAWISLSATAAVAGLLSGRTWKTENREWRRASPNAPLHGKTVLIMPIYNEDAASVCAALAAMGEDLNNLGLQEKFEIFVLSDTNSSGIIPHEIAAVEYLQDHLRGTLPVWYCRREQNTDKKAGNIRNFIKRWGHRYDYMVVLDADSLIAGETLATLVREMDADPSAGILQTLPRLYGGETVFARLQQFASVTYGTIFARGLSAWQGHGGNYWGHNAIIRIKAFAESAGLPSLSGPRPFGGEIRSHDFVEAALIHRAGWSVRMLPELSGSWEECPPTLLDAAIRDRRWAQGNVQHLAVVPARGLRWQSRVHLLMGVMNYLTSLLWLAMVTVGLVLTIQFAQPRMQSLASDVLPAFDSERMISLFVFTMTLLLLPKILGITGGLISRKLRGGYGRFRFVISALLEMLFSILHAPIFMLIHSRHLLEIALGQDSGWTTQQRQGNGVQWRHLLVRHGTHTLLGLLVAGLLLWASVPLLYWMLPMVIGLILAVPLSALSGSKAAGRWLESQKLLGIPEELTLPDIMKRRQQFLATSAEAITADTGDEPAITASGEKYRLYSPYAA